MIRNMFQYLATVGIFLLMVFPAITVGEDSSTETASAISTLDSTSVYITNEPVTDLGSNNTTGGGGGSNSPNSAGGVTGVTSDKHSVASTGTPATTAYGSTTVVTTTDTPFFCYQGNCTGQDCHKNESLYSNFTTVICTAKECSINIKGSLTEFNCNSKQCICETKVAGMAKMCCKKSKCNSDKLDCSSHSSSLATSLVVLVISFVSQLMH